MTVSPEFVDFVLDQMEGFGTVYARRMFGGVGLYFDDIFFGIISNDAVYLKVDESTKPRYEHCGARPFQPYGDGSYSMSYYEVPANVLEDRDELRTWAREAVAVAALKAAEKTKARVRIRRK
jgi:DNA transformation protein